MGVAVVVGGATISWTGCQLEPDFHPEAAVVVVWDGMGVNLVNRLEVFVVSSDDHFCCAYGEWSAENLTVCHN